MNPLIVEALGSIARSILNIGAGYLVAHGIWSSTDAEKYVGSVALILVATGWSLYQKHGMRVKLLTAMAMPAGVSEKHVEAVIKADAGNIPPSSQPKDAVVKPLAKP